MSIPTVTVEDITEACRAIYEPGRYQHCPAQLFYEHLDFDPPTTYMRVSFPESFTYAAAGKLEQLRKRLLKHHGRRGNIVFVVYMRLLDPVDMAKHSASIAAR